MQQADRIYFASDIEKISKEVGERKYREEVLKKLPILTGNPFFMDSIKTFADTGAEGCTFDVNGTEESLAEFKVELRLCKFTVRSIPMTPELAATRSAPFIRIEVSWHTPIFGLFGA